MPFKTFGKLAGNSPNAEAALSDTTSAPRRAPQTPIATATKFAMWTENATSRAWNRMLGALSTNDDAIGGYLDTPALRDDLLHYFTDANTGFAGNGKFGFPALWFADPKAVDVLDQVEINLGLADTGLSRPGGYVDTNVKPPPTWVYVGLTKEQLGSGKVMRLFRESDDDKNVAGGVSNRGRSYFGRELVPEYVKENSGAVVKYHTATATASVLGDSPHALPDFIGSIVPVTSDVAPYNGASPGLLVSTWESDGPIIHAPDLWEDYHVRPGCFVYVSGDVAQNNGMWLVKSVAEDKAILTTGALMRVTVEAGGGLSYALGQMVTWASPPGHAAAALTMEDRDNRAYVAYIDTDTLWLLPTAAAEDSSTGANSGSKVAHVIDSATANGPMNTARSGDVGFPDRETDATENWAMPVGTKLYPVDYTTMGSTLSKDVVDVLPAGHPVVFDIDGVGGTCVVHSPPGFLLNPVVGLETMISAPHKVMPGKYSLKCKTLTTNRERLSKGAWSVNIAESEDPSGSMAGHSTDYYQTQIKTALEEMHHGHSRDTTGRPYHLSPWDSPLRNFMGSSLWLIVSDFGGTGIGTKFEDNTASEINADDYLVFSNTTAGAGDVRVRVVAGWDEYLLVKHPMKENWTSQIVEADKTVRALNVGCTITIGGDLYTATSIHEADVSHAGGYVDSESIGLNSVYNSLHSSEEFERSKGLGNVISMLDTRPITMVFQGGGAQKALRVVSDSTDIELYTVADSTGDLGLLKWDGTTFTLTDVLTPASVPFTEPAIATSVAYDVPSQAMYQSILGGIQAGVPGGGTLVNTYSTTTTAPIRGGVLSVGIGLNVDITAGSYMYKGAIWELDGGATAIPNAAQDNFIYVDFTTVPATYGNANLVTMQTLILNGNYALIGSANGDGFGAVVGVQQLHMHLNRDDMKAEIYVGAPAAGEYSGGLTHYDTMYEAMIAIGYINTIVPEIKRTHIKLVGNTTETVTPIPFYADNVTIEGVSLGGTADGAPTVSWSALTSLFDLQSSKDVIFKNVRMKWTGAAVASGATLNVAGIISSIANGADHSNLIVEDCYFYGGEAFVYINDMWNSVSIRGCTVEHITNTAVYIATMPLGTMNENIVIEGNHFSQFHDGVFQRATNDRVCIYIERAKHIRIADNKITSSPTKGYTGGIYIVGEDPATHGDFNPYGGTTIVNNHIESVDSADPINLNQWVGAGSKVLDNTIYATGDSLAAGVTAIQCDNTAVVRGNYIYSGSCKGIVAAGADSIVDGNIINTLLSRAIDVTGAGSKVSGNSVTDVCISNSASDNGAIYVNAANIHVTDNSVKVADVVRTNIAEAILADTSADYAVISGNRIIDPSNDPFAYVPRGIIVGGEGSTIANNNLAGGHITLGPAAVWSTVSGNVQNMEDGSVSSLGLSVAAPMCSITGNATGGGPIALQSTAHSCNVTGNSTGRQNASYPSTGGDITIATNRSVISGNTLHNGNISLVAAAGHSVISDNKCAGDESLTVNGISGITNTNPAVVTTYADHNLTTGQMVDISGAIVTAPDDVNDTGLVVTVTGLNSFSVAKNASGGAAPAYGIVQLNNTKGLIDLNAAGLGSNTVIGNYVRGISNIQTSDRPRHKSITLTGIVDIAANTNVVLATGGVGTIFLSELEPGDWITAAGETHRVLSILNDTSLALVTNHVAGAGGVSYTRDRLEYDHNSVT